MEQGLHKGHNLLYYECTDWKTPERTKYRDEKDFELLQALADSRNITKAADKLYITQSALSKRIRAIERELGVELLRSHQGIRFTPPGRLFWPTAERRLGKWTRCAETWMPCKASSAPENLRRNP